MKKGSSEVDGEGGPSDVGRLVDSSQADDRRMIRLVRERRLLYARNNMPVASYYSHVKKLWQEVADQMEWTVAEVRRKWSHIRNSYSRHLRNELHGVRTGRGRMVSRWYLADELQFLREHMATDTRPCRYSYSPLYVNPKPEAPPPTERVDIQPFLGNPWFSLSQETQIKTEKREPSEPATGPDDSVSPPGFDADENTAYFQFFRGIYNDYQELPAARQRQFRRECLAALHRLLDEEDALGSDESAAAINLTSHRHHHHHHRDDTALCVIENVSTNCDSNST